MNNYDDRLWVLIGKKLAGEASAADLEELRQLAHEEGLLAKDIEMLEKLWRISLLHTGEAVGIDNNWAVMEQTLFEENETEEITPVINIAAKKRFPKKYFYMAAASLLLICIAALAVKFINPGKGAANRAALPEAMNEVVSKHGSKSSVVLPEGTKVWLNAGSKIYYHKDFTSNREVYLSGEAFFDVTHNASQPFTIHAGPVNIKVLGTAFNVKAYPEDDLVETALLRGSIELTTVADPGRKILLRPNEKITINKTKPVIGKNKALPPGKPSPKEELYSISRMLVYKKGSTLEDIAWMEDKLIFKGETFIELSTKMERWYDVEMIFKNEQVKRIKFTGAFDKQNIVQALQALQFSCNYQFIFSISKNQVSISPK